MQRRRRRIERYQLKGRRPSSPWTRMSMGIWFYLSLLPLSCTPSSRESSPALSQPTTAVYAATIPLASETNATTTLHTIPASSLTAEGVCLKSPSHSSPEISTRVRPREIIKQKVWDAQAMSDEEGCTNSDCDDPSHGGEMVYCAELSCP